MEQIPVFNLYAVVVEGSKRSVRLSSGSLDIVTRLASQLFPVIDCSLEITNDQEQIVCSFIRCSRVSESDSK